MKSTFRCFAAAAIVFTANSNLFAQHSFTIQKTFHIQSSGGWDYLAVSPAKPWLYVSHGTQVNVLNKTTGDSIGIFPNTAGVHGIAFAQEYNKGFISNGRLNNVFVFDMATNLVVDSIQTDTNPDAMCYDGYSKKIFVGNGRSKTATVIDVTNNKVVATIDLGGKPEASVSDEHGKVYVNIEDKNEIAVIDVKTMKITKRYSVAPGEEPSGLVIDNKTHRLFAGCGNKQMIVLDAATGKHVATLPIGDGCDGLGYDAATGNVFASNGDGTLTVVHSDKGAYKVTANILTQAGARTIAVDPASHWIYLPTADFQPQAAGSKERRKTIPGTFRILVIGT